MEPKSITVQIKVNATPEKVWQYWNEADHIKQWAFASDDWEAVPVFNDLKVGGKFKTTMGAKDKSASFDFSGVYTAVNPPSVLEYDLDDGRHVSIKFEPVAEGVQITQTFDMESENSEEVQRAGWQAFLDNFKKHVES